MNQLTQKETLLLKDEKSHEELCIKKYTKSINEAHDPQLKQVFTQILSHEQQHLNTINSIMAGQIPTMNQGQQQNQAQANQNTTPSGTYDASDADLCQDALTTEKYISSTYNTTIFEFKNPQIRQVLNHIQKEEQEHGQQIYQYMESHGMYNG